MSVEQQKNNFQEFPFHAFLQSSSDIWGQMTRMWFDNLQPDESILKSFIQNSGEANQGNHNGLWEQMLTSWQNVASSIPESPDMTSLFGSSDLQRDMLQTILNGWYQSSRIQQAMFDSSENIQKTAGIDHIDKISQEFIEAWKETYEQTLKKYLNVPQLGLTREYQEKMLKVYDKFSMLQSTILQFLFFLSIPFKNSFKTMHKELSEIAKKGELPKDYKAYYQIWIKILEQYFQALFRTSDYTSALAKTLSAFGEFKAVLDDLTQDYLKASPIPTQKDMDDLYKDIYTLKKRIQKIEKQNKK